MSLFVVKPDPCPVCGLHSRRKRRQCKACNKSGFTPTDISGLWRNTPGFLLCGGPSLRTYPLEELRQRGVISFAINNAAAFAPATAWTFGDGEEKFHHGCHLDPKCLTFAPIAKLRSRVRAKLSDGSFRYTTVRLWDCPGTYGLSRSNRFNPKNFLTTPYAHWGKGGKKHSTTDDGKPKFRRLCTMLLGLRIMHYLGCPRVYMLGVDFWQQRGDAYAWGTDGSGGNGAWWKMNEYLRQLRPHFEEHGYHVYNCNPDSRCDAFDCVPFEIALDDCRGAVPREPLDCEDWYSKRIKHEQIAKHSEHLSKTELRNYYLSPQRRGELARLDELEAATTKEPVDAGHQERTRKQGRRQERTLVGAQ